MTLVVGFWQVGSVNYDISGVVMVRVLSKREFVDRFVNDIAEKRKRDKMVMFVKKGGSGYEFSREQVVDMCQRWEKGETMTSIGRQYGCSRQTVRNRIKQFGKEKI
jgi:Mor family transcriptional regulator